MYMFFSNLLMIFTEVVESTTETITSIGSFQDFLDLVVQTWDKINVWLPAVGIPSLVVFYKCLKTVFNIFQKRNELKVLDNESKIAGIKKIEAENNTKALQIQNILLEFLPIFKLLIETTYNESLKAKGEELYNQVVKSINEIYDKAIPIVDDFEKLGNELNNTGNKMVEEIIKVENNTDANSNTDNSDSSVVFTGE